MSPRGCLAPDRLRRSVLKKRIAGFWFDRNCLRGASAVHATCEAERREIEVYLGGYGAQIPHITVVPNGVDADEWRTTSDRKAVEQCFPACRGKRISLFLGRIDPIKGLDLLVNAFREIASEFCGWHLLIAGPDGNGYVTQVQKMIERAGIGFQVTLCGSVYGEDKRMLLNSVDLFVLPTYNENFGMVVAEALACGVPVITTKGAPWSELLGNSDSSLVHYCVSALVEKKRTGGNVEHATIQSLPTNERMNSRTHEIARLGRAGWWVDIGVEPLVEALKEAMSLTDEERHAMGENGRRLVKEKYRWESVAQEMEKVYSGIVNSKR